MSSCTPYIRCGSSEPDLVHPLTQLCTDTARMAHNLHVSPAELQSQNSLRSARVVGQSLQIVEQTSTSKRSATPTNQQAFGRACGQVYSFFM